MRPSIVTTNCWLDGIRRPYNSGGGFTWTLGFVASVSGPSVRDRVNMGSQARSVIRTGGNLILETAAVVNHNGSFMLFNGVPPCKKRVYDDLTTWWAPTVLCLKEMLRASLFEPVESSIRILDDAHMTPTLRKRVLGLMAKNEFAISRVSVVAKAVGSDTVDAEYYRELARVYRNPGLVVEHLTRQDGCR